MRIGFPELIVVFIVALIVIGPDKLPLYAKKFGAALREFRGAANEVTSDIKKSVVEPLNEAQEPLREAVKPFEEITNDINSSVKDLDRSVRDIGKTEKEKPKTRLERQEEELERQKAEIEELKAQLAAAGKAAETETDPVTEDKPAADSGTTEN